MAQNSQIWLHHKIGKNALVWFSWRILCMNLLLVVTCLLSCAWSPRFDLIHLPHRSQLSFNSALTFSENYLLPTNMQWVIIAASFQVSPIIFCCRQRYNTYSSCVAENPFGQNNHPFQWDWQCRHHSKFQYPITLQRNSYHLKVISIHKINFFQRLHNRFLWANPMFAPSSFTNLSLSLFPPMYGFIVRRAREKPTFPPLLHLHSDWIEQKEQGGDVLFVPFVSFKNPHWRYNLTILEFKCQKRRGNCYKLIGTLMSMTFVYAWISTQLKLLINLSTNHEINL
jgi:hypothetical protein